MVGEGGRNSRGGAGEGWVNMSVNKTITIKKSRGVDLGLTENNIFNIVHFTAINTVVNSRPFGEGTGTDGMRRVTMQARFRVLRKTHMQLRKKTFSVIAAAMLLSRAAAPVPAQQMGQAESRIQVTSELVLVNVVAHDKKGNLVRDLKKGDFTLFEDGKKQEISTFDFENVDQLPAPPAAQATVSGAAEQGALLRSGK